MKRRTQRPKGKPAAFDRPALDSLPDWKPNEAEIRAVADHKRRKAERIPAPQVKFLGVENDTARISTPHKGQSEWMILTERAFGTTENAFASWQTELVMNATVSAKNPKEAAYNAALAAVHALAPRDEIESMLIVQMVAVHYAAMNTARVLKSVETIPQQDSASNAFNKLTRAFTMQLEALNRYRGKGQQKVVVEHVHVHEGGQAIVGTVEGGGVRGITEDQPHAKPIAYAPGETLPSQDAQGAALPIAGNS